MQEEMLCGFHGVIDICTRSGFPKFFEDSQGLILRNLFLSGSESTYFTISFPCFRFL